MSCESQSQHHLAATFCTKFKFDESAVNGIMIIMCIVDCVDLVNLLRGSFQPLSYFTQIPKATAKFEIDVSGAIWWLNLQSIQEISLKSILNYFEL